jgi:hypothetical protein
MPILLASLLIQAAFVAHILKTDRNRSWIWIVVFLPLIGSIAYLFMELLPAFWHRRTAKDAEEDIINPEKDLKAAAQNFAASIEVSNALKLADKFLTNGMYAEAKNLYERALTGIHEDDPDILLSLAKAEFMLSNYSKAKFCLSELKDRNPDYDNQDAHLLYARSIEHMGDTKKALREYAVLVNYYSGAEAKYRYAMLLSKEGEKEKGKDLLVHMLQASQAAGEYFMKLNEEWIILAKEALSAE